MTIPKTSDTFRRWTGSAILCYERKFKCNGCNLKEFCDRRQTDMFYRLKPMKYAVLVLFAKHGKPKRSDYERAGIKRH